MLRDKKGPWGNAKAQPGLLEQFLPVDGDQHSRGDVLALRGFHGGKEPRGGGEWELWQGEMLGVLVPAPSQSWQLHSHLRGVSH